MTTVEAHSTADLRTDQTLPSSVVHKAALEQVFVTDWMRGPGDDWCTIAARLPLAHGRFSDTAAPYHDILLIAETVRQGGLVVAEEIINVPGDRQFLLRELKVDLEPIEHCRRTRDNCEVLISQDPSSQVKMRPGRSMAGGVMRARIAIGGRSAGMCQVTGAWVPDSFYAQLRGTNRDATSAEGLPEPTPRTDVETRTGKVNPANSVLTPIRPSGEPRGYEAALVINTDDPTFFDHHLDHVPGLYLLEGVQQVAVAAACHELGVEPAHVVVCGFEMTFSRIAEFQPDVVCAVGLDEDGRSGAVSCSQSGRVCCQGSVRIAHV
jgi:2-oxo-3-(phosphooxy)propyl 3-oxoalkanoate synthase